MDIIAIINNTAGVATLVLFVIYFIGRAITILSVEKIWRDRIVDKAPGHLSTSLNVVDVISLEDRESNGFGAYIVSTEGIREFKVYKTEIKSEDDLTCCKGELIYSKDFININEAIDIDIELGEIIPPVIVEYLSQDYMRVTIEWVMNGKNGVASEMIHPKHTIKSFCYYLFR